MSEISTLSGWIDVLSGDISTLGTRITDNERIIIGLPSATDYSRLASSHASRFNELSSDLADALEDVRVLQQYVVNLKLAHGELSTLVTAHTGIPAVSGHLGGLSGEL